MSATIIIIAVTVIVSMLAFSNQNILSKFMFYPYLMQGKIHEFYRFLSHGFIHADMQHLAFNMFTMFSFGTFVERNFNPISFAIFYLLAIVVSSIPDFIKHKTNGSYRSLGASGGTSAVVFAGILYQPWLEIWFVPGFIFGLIYIGYSTYATQRNNDNIGHMAHISGALFGIVYVIVMHADVLTKFIYQVTNPKIFYRLLQ